MPLKLFQIFIFVCLSVVSLNALSANTLRLAKSACILGCCRCMRYRTIKLLMAMSLSFQPFLKTADFHGLSENGGIYMQECEC